MCYSDTPLVCHGHPMNEQSRVVWLSSCQLVHGLPDPLGQDHTLLHELNHVKRRAHGLVILCDTLLYILAVFLDRQAPS